MLRWRLASAAVIITLLLTSVWLDHLHPLLGVSGAWLVPVLLLITLLATEEMLSLFAAKGLRPATWPVYSATITMVLAASGPVWCHVIERSDLAAQAGPLSWPLVPLAIGVMLSFCAEMQRYERPGTATMNVGLAALAMVYIGVLLAFVAALRLHGPPVRGMAALVSMLFIVKTTDVGAYLFGRVFGRHKMTPILSPGKTIEGAMGGLAAACFAAWLCFEYIVPNIVGSSVKMAPLLNWIVYGLVIGIAGMIGDLAESLLKRDMQRKDSSTWLPGLGGVLDVIDSVLFAAPVAYLFWTCGWL